MLSTEQLEVLSGAETDYSIIGQDIGKRLLGRTQGARLVGLETLQVIKNVHLNGQPEISKARWVVSEWASQTRTRSGKALPSDEKALGDKSKKFFDAAHLWAAFESLSDEERDGFPHETSGFDKMLLIASVYEEFLIEFEALESKKFHWNPWRVPPQFLERYRDEAVFVGIEKDNPWIAQKLDEYRPRRFRDM